MAWTDEEIELLRKLHADGLSNELISEKMGSKTRNAVLGKIHRLGLSGTKAHPHRPTITKKAAEAGWRTKPRKSAKAKQAKPRVVKARSAFQELLAADADGYVPPVEELVIPVGERKTLQDLNDGDCRWPIGHVGEKNFHFCGKGKVTGLPYCQHHARVAFRPPVAATQSAAGRPFVFSGHPGSGAPRMPATDKPRETEDVS